MEWNKLDVKLNQSQSLPYFRNALLKVVPLTVKPIYNIHNPISWKLLTRLRLGLNHLNERKFKRDFHDCINPLCTRSLEIESFSHFVLHCQIRWFNFIRTNQIITKHQTSICCTCFVIFLNCIMFYVICL